MGRGLGSADAGGALSNDPALMVRPSRRSLASAGGLVVSV